MKNILHFVVFSFFMTQIISQNLPVFMNFSPDHKRLITGNVKSQKVFDEDIVHTFEINFKQADYLAQLTANYRNKVDLLASITIDGKKVDSVGVRYKGQTSYSRVTSRKKSFNITMNSFIKGQDLQGYETFNLNNCFEDPSYMREVNYLSHERHHSPAARGAFAKVIVNGEFWGLYALVQGLDSEFINEWFLNNDGTRWRAERTTTGGGGAGGFGAGTSSINFLGEDTSLYKPHYTLKKSKLDNPWRGLMVAAEALNRPALTTMYDTLNKVMDVDRALWFVAHEIMFGDDDSYINKGGMDYYVYFDQATGRLVPLEYDGNSNMEGTTASWSIFNKETDTKFPLANRLFAVPELRQRYLAHCRTLYQEYLDKTTIDAKIEKYYNLIDSAVKAETNRIYTYAQFQTGKTDFIKTIDTRRGIYTNHAEFKRIGPSITNVTFATDGRVDLNPNANQKVTINANITSASGIKAVNLYYAAGFDGRFNRTIMYDDGMHSDQAAADGIYGALIPEFAEGEYVRFYVEASANDGAGTASYMPIGAEHDVYIYRVNIGKSSNADIVINEFMATNTSTAADQDGEFDDWIELYNTSNQSVDISGWSLSDNADNLTKFTFNQGISIGPKEYLIIWADEDGKQAGLHANFKLSSAGETLYLIDDQIKLVDSITYHQQTTDLSFSRVPNGRGGFIIQKPTYNKSNDLSSSISTYTNDELNMYPNPAKQYVVFEKLSASDLTVDIRNVYGELVQRLNFDSKIKISTSDLLAGMYMVQHGKSTKKLLIQH